MRPVRWAEEGRFHLGPAGPIYQVCFREEGSREGEGEVEKGKRKGEKAKWRGKGKGGKGKGRGGEGGGEGREGKELSPVAFLACPSKQTAFHSSDLNVSTNCKGSFAITELILSLPENRKKRTDLYLSPCMRPGQGVRELWSWTYQGGVSVSSPLAWHGRHMRYGPEKMTARNATFIRLFALGPNFPGYVP